MEERLVPLVERKGQAVTGALAGSSDKHAVALRMMLTREQSSWKTSVDWKAYLKKPAGLKTVLNWHGECWTSESANVKRSGLLGEESQGWCGQNRETKKRWSLFGCHKGCMREG